MTQLMIVEDQRRNEILQQAAERLTIVALAHRVDSHWVTYKTRLLEADAAGQHLTVEQPLHTPEQAPPELVPGEVIGLTFRRGHRKCMCSVEVLNLLTFPCAEQAVPAIKVAWPEKLQEMQRRVYYRVGVPKGRRIEVHMWDGGLMDRDTPQLRERPHHIGLLHDISAGGCSVLIDAAKDPQLAVGETVGMQFQADPRSAPCLLDTVFKHAERVSKSKLVLGFQFVGLEMTPQGRRTLQALSRVVGTFLRIEARRKNRRTQKHPRSKK